MADEKFFMEVNKNTKLENSQTNRWLVGTMWHYAWQSLNNLGTFIGWGLTRLGDGCKSLFSRATTTTKTVDSTTNSVPCEQSVDSEEYKSDKFLCLKRERDNGTIQNARQNVQKNSRIVASTKGINFDEEESHKEINIKEENYEPLTALGLNFSFASSQQAYNLWDSQQTAHFGEFHTEINIKEDNHNPLNALKGLDFKGTIFEVINPILKNPNGEREISNKHVEFDTKVAVLLFDEEESPAEPQNKVKSFKEIDFSDKGREENKGMIRKSSYEVADEFKSFKGSDLKKSFIQIGGKVIKKSK